MSAACEYCSIEIPSGHNFCSDCGGIWMKRQRASAKLERQALVGRNKMFAIQMLKTCDVKFIEKNGGEHVIILGDPATDYWPGTGLFIQRDTKAEGRGIYNLLQLIGVKAPKEAKP